MESMHKEEDGLEVIKKSAPVKMEGGIKYKIKYEVFHSVHNEYAEDSASYAKLKWSSD